MKNSGFSVVGENLAVFVWLKVVCFGPMPWDFYCVAQLMSAEIQLSGKLWPKNKMSKPVLISVACKMKSWGQYE